MVERKGTTLSVRFSKEVSQRPMLFTLYQAVPSPVVWYKGPTAQAGHTKGNLMDNNEKLTSAL